MTTRGIALVFAASLGLPLAAAAVSCGGESGQSGSGGNGGAAAATPPSSGAGAGGGIVDNTAARPLFVATVQPLLAESCGPCHLGKRFAFASLERAGASFTEEETERNYRAFLKMISLDAPAQSR